MTSKEKLKILMSQVPTSDEFSRTLGQATWLMTISQENREKSVSFLESQIVAPLMLKQLRLYKRGKQPVAFLTWAYASPSVKARIDGGDFMLDLQDWRSGSDVCVVRCVSPFCDKGIFSKRFEKEVLSAIRDGNPV